MKRITGLLLTFCMLQLCYISCEETTPDLPNENELLDGPMEGLNMQERGQFLRGDEAFGDAFTIEEGLGPIFVSNSCISCHTADGKGSPFLKLTRFGQSDTTGNSFLKLGAPQIQNRAIPTFQPEKLPSNAPSTDLIAPAVSGLGFLDAVSDEDLLALSDPNDEDGDGISGRLHWNTLPDYVQLRPESIEKNGKYISRFGKKAGAYDLLHQTAVAFNQDMGVTSLFEPIDPLSRLEVDPEVSTQVINDVVFYLKTLKAPIPRNQDDPEVRMGKNLFSQIECAKCHTPTLRTSKSPIAALSEKEFHPYTDLLLHDMGPGLNDGYTEGFALGSEWRTPALWGLGLSQDVQGNGKVFLMHDGRAASIEEAILMHGGEAENAKNNYNSLSQTEKNMLIKFLESL